MHGCTCQTQSPEDEKVPAAFQQTRCTNCCTLDGNDWIVAGAPGRQFSVVSALRHASGAHAFDS